MKQSPGALALVFAVLVLCLVPASVSADDLARLCPIDAIVFVELREAEKTLAFVEKWLKTMTGRDPLKEPLAEVAKELKMKPDELRAEIAKFKGAALIWEGFVEEKADEPSGMWIVDFGTSRKVLDAVEKAMAADAPDVVRVAHGVKIYGERDMVACIVGSRLFFGNSPGLIEAAVARAKGVGKADLTQSPRFRKVAAEIDPKAPLYAYMDVQNLRPKMLAKWGRDKDVLAVDALLDLKTVESLFAVVRFKDGKLIFDASCLFNGENPFYKALRTKIAVRSVERFYSADYTQVLAGTLIDGKAQWKAVERQISRAFEAAGQRNEFAEVITKLEETFGTKVGDELARVSEFAFGIRFKGGEELTTPDVLFALKLTDVDRFRALMKKVEAEAPGLEVLTKKVEGVEVRYLSDGVDSDYAYTVVGKYALGSNRVAAVEDAIRTWKRKKSILDSEPVKKALADLHHPNSKLMLVDLRRIPFMGDELGKKVGPSAVSTVEKPRRIDVRGDLGGFFATMFMWSFTYAGAVDVPLQ